MHRRRNYDKRKRTCCVHDTGQKDSSLREIGGVGDDLEMFCWDD